MTFVPVVPHVPRPSRRARELGEKLRATIEDYQRYDPDTTTTDVRQALALAGGGGVDARRKAAVLVGLLGAFALLGVWFMLRNQGLDSPSTFPALAVMVALLLVVAVVVLLRRS